MLTTKPSVRFFDPILDALQRASEQLGCDLVITSGTDGMHSGPDDPHPLGRAYDVRSHGVPDKNTTLLVIMQSLNDGLPISKDGGWVTLRFFGWLENAGLSDEHYHVQWRHVLEAPALSRAASPPR